MAKKSAKLKEIQDMVSQYGQLLEQLTDTEALRAIRDAFETVEDRRFHPYVEHPLPDIVMISLIAVMSGDNEWFEIGLFAVKKGDFAVLGLVRGFFGRRSLKNIRWGLALDFEHDIGKIFCLLNVDAVRSLLLPSPP